MVIHADNNENITFKRANLNDVAGDYHHSDDSTTDNRRDCGNATTHNVSGSHNDSSQWENSAERISNAMNITVNGPFTQTVYFYDAGVSSDARSTKLPRGSPTKRDIATPNLRSAPVKKT